MTAIALLSFLALAWKQPYKGNNLIGNLDPFPDTLHYIVPAIQSREQAGRRFSLLNTMKRPDGEMKAQVPPLYTWALSVGYAFNPDPRTYYFVNISLGIVSIAMLGLLSHHLTRSAIAVGATLGLYVLTFVVYWQPSLAMAENLLLPLLIINLWFFTQPLEKKRLNLHIAFLGLLAISLYGTKYIALPLSITFLIALAERIWQLPDKHRLNAAITFGLTCLVGFIALDGQRILYFLSHLSNALLGQNSESASIVSWLSLDNITNTLPKYISALFGAPIYNLWLNRSVVPPLLAFIVIPWLVYSLKISTWKKLSLLLLALLISQLAFLGLISMVEGRYAFTFLPILLIGFSSFMGWILAFFGKQNSNKTFAISTATVALVIALYFLVEVNNLKTQLLLNFRPSEVSWWHVGIKAAEKHFPNTLIENSAEKKLLITRLPPYYWDIFTSLEEQLDIMPMRIGQDMTNEAIWSIPLPANSEILWKHYQKQLSNGKVVYLSTVGFNQEDWQMLEALKANGWQLDMIESECANACQLLRVSEAPVPL